MNITSAEASNSYVWLGNALLKEFANASDDTGVADLDRQLGVRPDISSRTGDSLFLVDWNVAVAVTVASPSWHDVGAGAEGNPYHDHVYPPTQYDIVDELAARRHELATLWPRLWFATGVVLDWPNSTRQTVWCPKPSNASQWNFAALDIKVKNFQAAVMYPETTILQLQGLPAWACADGTCTNATVGLADPTGVGLGVYFSRVLSWYKGGFVDDEGVHHHSGNNITFGYLEVLNEVDIDSHIYHSSDQTSNWRRYIDLYDGIARTVRRDHPRMKFIGSCLSGRGSPESWAYFLNRSNHALDTPWPIEGVSFHAYVSIPGGTFVPWEAWGEMLFASARTVLAEAKGATAAIHATSPQTKVFVDEVGICNSCSGSVGLMNLTSLRSSNSSWWNLHSALWAVMHGELAAMGVAMTGASQLLGYPAGPPGTPVGIQVHFLHSAHRINRR